MSKRLIENPGSPEAVKLGCKCSILDNNNGLGIGKDDEGHELFWYSGECDYHQQYPIGKPSQSATPEEGKT